MKKLQIGIAQLSAIAHNSGILEREGRLNVYQLHGELPLRHPVESHCTVQGLIRFVLDSQK